MGWARSKRAPALIEEGGEGKDGCIEAPRMERRLSARSAQSRSVQREEAALKRPGAATAPTRGALGAPSGGGRALFEAGP